MIDWTEQIKDCIRHPALMWSQKRLADHLQVGEVSLSRWLNKRAEPDIDSARRICSFFGGITIEDIYKI